MSQETVRIPLAQLVADTRYQPRVAGLNGVHLDMLAESDPDAWPPLLVTPDGTGTYRILDGFHRHEAARRLGLADLPCRVLDGAGGMEALRTNLSHGLPLSRDDRRALARWLHGQHPDWSLRRIGREVGLNHETVKAAIDGASGGPRLVRLSDLEANAGNRQRPAPGDDGSPPTAYGRGGTDTNHVRSLVRSLARAERDGEGRILGLFGDRRAEHVADALAAVKDADAAAKALDAWAPALAKGVALYRKRKEAAEARGRKETVREGRRG